MPKVKLEYDEAVMEQLFRRGDWRNWDDCIRWLKGTAEQASSLTASHVSCLVEHLTRLRDSGIPFPLDYREAFQLVQQHCATTIKP